MGKPARIKSETVVTVDPKEARRSILATAAKENPFRFFTSEETGLMLDLGENVMTMLRGLGAPVVGKKMNPMLLMEWLKENHDRVTKVRSEDDEEEEK